MKLTLVLAVASAAAGCKQKETTAGGTTSDAALESKDVAFFGRTLTRFENETGTQEERLHCKKLFAESESVRRWIGVNFAEFSEDKRFFVYGLVTAQKERVDHPELRPMYEVALHSQVSPIIKCKLWRHHATPDRQQRLLEYAISSPRDSWRTVAACSRVYLELYDQQDLEPTLMHHLTSSDQSAFRGALALDVMKFGMGELREAAMRALGELLDRGYSKWQADWMKSLVESQSCGDERLKQSIERLVGNGPSDALARQYLSFCEE